MKLITTTTTGYVILSAKGLKTQKVTVRTADEASAAWWKFVQDNGFGASALKKDSGLICDASGKPVARVGYNGRVWDLDGKLLQEAV